jgi:arsenite-transporting ATPase
MADALFGERDPADRFFVGQAHILESTGEDSYTLRLPLPFADKSSLELYRSTDEITLKVGGYRRNIVLPRTLWPLEVASARMADGELTICFEKTDDED